MAYPPPYYTSDDKDLARQLIADHPFALLTLPDLRAAHIPLIAEDGPEGLILHGHLARDNPMSSALADASQQALAVFSGPHAYISAAQYSRPERQVPTWNFQAVHAWGHVQTLDEAGSWDSLLRLTRAMDTAWTLEQAEAAARRMLPAITAFRLPVSRLRIWNKMSANKTLEERDRLAAALDGGSDVDRKVAALMRKS